MHSALYDSGMISDENAAILKDWADGARADQAKADETAKGRDDAIRHAMKLGARVGEVVNLTGLSRARVYQIRDGRR